MSDTQALLPALRHALWPAPDRTLLLRACLGREADAWPAWEAWRAGVASARLNSEGPATLAAGEVSGLGDTTLGRKSLGPVGRRLADRQSGARRLVPMLYRSARRNGFALEPEVLTHLRTATLYEGLRSRTYRRICRPALAALAALALEAVPGDANIPALTLKGAGLAATVYERWSLRHCHDLDLLAAEAAVPQVAAALASAGFAAVSPATVGVSLAFKHASGLPALVHTTLFEIPYYRPPLASVWADGHPAWIAGAPVRVLAPAHALVHVIGHAACSRGRETLQWAADACALIEGAPHLDWVVVESFAREGRMALPLAVMLDYLATELGAAVPDGLVERLTATAGEEPAALDAALAGARAGSRAAARDLLGLTPGWLPRLRLAGRLAYPSPEYRGLSRRLKRTGQLLWRHARRGLSHAARHVRAWLGRADRASASSTRTL